MSVALKSLPLSPVAPAPWLSLRRFTVQQYERMVELGILTGNDRVELLEGWIVDKVTQNPPRAGTLWLVQTALLRVLPAEWIVRVQSAIRTQASMPEPDIAVAKGPGQRYLTTHPSPKDVGLVVEVADTTVLEDRNEKWRIYARARIPLYWLVNLQTAAIEVYTDPKGGRWPGYQSRNDYGQNDAIPLVLEGHDITTIPVRDLLR